MTIGTDVAQSGPYFPNGVVTSFPFGISISDPSDISVIWILADGSEVGISPASYTVTLSESEPGGTVVFSAAPSLLAAGAALWIVLDPEFEQQDRYSDEGPFNQSLLEGSLDRLARLSIWLKARVDRTLRSPFGETLTTLPIAAQRAGKFLAFDIDGLPIAAEGTAVGDAAVITYLPSGTGAVTRPVQAKLRETVSVKDFGAVCDAVYNGSFVASGTDDTAAIQAALNAVGAAGGGMVILPGKSIISATLSIPQGVVLEGQGANWGRGANTRTANPRSFIKSALIHKPDATPFTPVRFQLGPDDGNSFRGVGGGLRDLFIDGQGIAPVNIEIRSWLGATFANVHSYNVNPTTGIGWLIGAFGNVGSVGETINRTTAFCDFYSCSHTGTGPKALVLSGSGWFNTAHLAFYNFEAESGTIDLEDCDSNEFHNLVGNLVLWGSVGPNHASSGVQIGGARHNVIFGHRGSVTAKAGTSVAAVSHPNYHSHSNTIYGKTNDNADQFPTIEAGADVTIHLPGFAKNDSRYGAFTVGGGVLQTRGDLTAATVAIAHETTTVVNLTVPATPHRNFLSAWASGNPSRITIPAGVKWVRFSAAVVWDVNATGIRYADIIRNGISAARVTSSIVPGAGTFVVVNHMQSPWLPVGPSEAQQTGDYYELRCRQNSGAALNLLRDGTYFMAEFR
jgi:hypothetical protein